MRQRSSSTSPAWRSTFQPPEPLSQPRWHLRPLHPDLADLDYDAWSSCRERLVEELGWDGWPTATFSRQDNRADLAQHFAEFERREAFAYSILQNTRCIGCIYVEPWTEGAQLAHWVTAEALTIEHEIVNATLDWLCTWPFERVIIPVRHGNLRGRALLEALGSRVCAGPANFISYERA
ncbi:MAG: hypothetical protein ACI9MC_000813 [Kiritimatiellia bacterium]|jgi:hypothetical protein